MTGNEFLATLSPIALLVMQEHSNERTKPIEVNVDYRSEAPAYMFESNDAFYIGINPNALKYNTELSFLHEYLHCSQITLGFPQIIAKNRENENDRNIAAMITSVVLDRNIEDYILPKYNLFPDKTFVEKHHSEMISELSSELKHPIIKHIKENPFGIDYFRYVLHTVNFYYSLGKEQASQLQNLFRELYPQMKTDSQTLIDLLNNFDFNNPSDCKKIFESIIKKLNLKTLVCIK